MMVIGANTPAMIRAMTKEVESKNLIVALHGTQCAESLALAAASAGSCMSPERFVEPLHARRHVWQRSHYEMASAIRK
jgi:hypothetical protein